VGVKEALITPGPDLVVCEEGRFLKNEKNNRTKFLMNIKTKRQIILTGTPLQNNLIEYYYMVHFVKPNLLGKLKEFTNRFMNPINNGQYQDSTIQDINLMRKRSHVLNRLLSRTMQRYEESELMPYLPEKLDNVVFISLHPVQIKLYKIFLDLIKDMGCKGNLFSNYYQMRNIWTHNYLLRMVAK